MSDIFFFLHHSYHFIVPIMFFSRFQEFLLRTTGRLLKSLHLFQSRNAPTPTSNRFCAQQKNSDQKKLDIKEV